MSSSLWQTEVREASHRCETTRGGLNIGIQEWWPLPIAVSNWEGRANYKMSYLFCTPFPPYLPSESRSYEILVFCSPPSLIHSCMFAFITYLQLPATSN